jgi:hypothetical protein
VSEKKRPVRCRRTDVGEPELNNAVQNVSRQISGYPRPSRRHAGLTRKLQMILEEVARYRVLVILVVLALLPQAWSSDVSAPYSFRNL